jgi:hypothetical protein
MFCQLCHFAIVFYLNVSCKSSSSADQMTQILLGDIDDLGDIANIANFAKSFFVDNRPNFVYNQTIRFLRFSSMLK